MTKIAILGDTHLGKKGASNTLANYIDEFFDYFFQYCNNEKIEHVIQLGDLIDSRKNINAKTVVQLNSYFNNFKHRNIKLHQMIGNHDVFYKNTNNINWVSSFINSNNRENVTCYENPQTIQIDDCKLDIIPWINEENYKEVIGFVENSSSEYLFGHLELAGFEIMKGFIIENGMSPKIFKRYQKVFSGHYHVKSEKGNILYTGIPYDLDFSDAEDEKGFYVFDTEDLSYEFIPYTKKLFYKLKYSDGCSINNYNELENSFIKLYVYENSNDKKYDDFLNKLYKVNYSDLSIINSVSIDSTDIEIDDIEIDDTKTLLVKYLQSNLEEDSYNEESIYGKIDELYQEAQIIMKEV